MQFDVAGDIIRRVRWYFVPPGTPWLPFDHQFGSHIWAYNGYFPPGLGERWDSIQTYRKGDIPWRIDPPTRVCGDPTWWNEGVPSDAPDLILSPAGQPQCCLDGSGIRVGGISTVDYIEPLKGGIRAGGESYLWPILYGTGGVETGGLLSAVLHGYYYGGIRPGGNGDAAIYARCYGGILVGGLAAPKLTAFVEGGILCGGTSVDRLLPPDEGGILCGGTSIDTLEYITSGGIYCGGISGVYETILGHGGIECGGLSIRELITPTTGGIRVGGTSVETLIDITRGGVKVGALAGIRLTEIVHGGIKVGATSTVYIGGSNTCCGATGTVLGLNFWRIAANEGIKWHGKFTKNGSSRPTALVLYDVGSGAEPKFVIFTCDGTPCSTSWGQVTAAGGKLYTSPNPTDLNEVIRSDNNPGTAWNAAVWVLVPCNNSYSVANACGTAFPMPYFPGWFMTSGGAVQYYSFTPTVSDTYTFKTWSASFTNTLTVFDSTCTTTLATGAGNTGFSVALTAGTQYKLRVAGTTIGVPISISAPSYPSYYLWK